MKIVKKTTLLVDRHRIGTSPSQRSGWEGRQSSLQRVCRGGVVAVDRHSNDADAPPQPRYRGLTLPKLRFGRVKLVVFNEKCQKNDSRSGRLMSLVVTRG